MSERFKRKSNILHADPGFMVQPTKPAALWMLSQTDCAT